MDPILHSPLATGSSAKAATCNAQWRKDLSMFLPPCPLMSGIATRERVVRVGFTEGRAPAAAQVWVSLELVLHVFPSALLNPVLSGNSSPAPTCFVLFAPVGLAWEESSMRVKVCKFDLLVQLLPCVYYAYLYIYICE